MPDPSAPRTAADRALVALVVAAAVVAASFPARNSDVWLRLAAGRAAVAGAGGFGGEPFSLGTAGRHWANPNWLFDVAAYGLFSAAGGAGLVAVKAAAVGLLAFLLVRLGRSNGPGWLAAGFALLAVVAMSPRLLLQPAVGSYLLLAGCLFLLRTGGPAMRLLPVLVAVWANLDSWYVLGPAVAGLYQLGQRLRPDGSPAVPVWTLPACLFACLLTPNHVHGLALPAELSPAVWRSGFSADPRFAGVFAGPWRTAAPSDWAFLVLLGLGGLSFLLNRRAWGWRLAVWLPLAALACWQARLVPFFAVVGGPIAALNLGEVLSSAWDRRAARLAVGGGAVLAAALASVGWLTGFAARDRELGWGVVTDPTLRTAAEAETDPAVLTTHPDLAHYLAWFAPNSRGHVDSRLTLFAPDAADAVAVGRAVGLLPDGELADVERLDALLRTTGAGRVLVYDPDPRRMTAAVGRLAADPLWTPVAVRGGVLVVRRRSASGGRFDPARDAYTPTAAPAGEPPPVEPPRWWDPRPARPRVGTADADAATVYLRLAEANPTQPATPALLLLAVRAANQGATAAPNDPVARLALARAYTLLAQAGNPPPLVLAVRRAQATAAARQATVADPDSPAAHDLLAALLTDGGAADAALPARQQLANLARRAGDRDRAERAEAAYRQAEAVVFDAENRFLVRTDRLSGDPLARARMAAELGLGGRAADILLASHPDLYGTDGLRLLLDLLLTQGRTEEAAPLLDSPELASRPDALGLTEVPGGRLPAVAWLQLLRAASAGRPVADRLTGLHARLAGEATAVRPSITDALARAVATEVGLHAPPVPVAVRLPAARERDRFAVRLAQADGLSRFAADLLVLAGILELDAGRPAADLLARGLAGNPAAGRPFAEQTLAAVRGGPPR